MCPGHPDSTFVEMAMAKKQQMTSLDGKTVVATVDSFAPVSLNGETYTTTVRHRSCDIIVKSGKCSHCVSYCGTLRKSFHRWESKNNTTPSRRTSTTSRVNFRFLNTPERKQWYKNLKARSILAERKVREMVAKLTHDHGVVLDSQLHDNLQGVMNKMTDEITLKIRLDIFSGYYFYAEGQKAHKLDYENC